MIAVDSSVAIAAALPWHESHRAARAAVTGRRRRALAHVAVETYSVLTRLPPPRRLAPAVARRFTAAAFASPLLTLDGRAYTELLDEVAAAGVAGGAVYDAVVAATAREAGATLLSLDRRAVRTYELLGARYRLLA